MSENLFLGGTQAQIIAALKAIDPDLVRKDERGNDFLGDIYTHEVALHYIDNVMTKRATYDDQGNTEFGGPGGNELTAAEFGGPGVMLKFLGQKGRDKLDQNGRLKAALPARVSRVAGGRFLNNRWAGE